MQELGIQAFTEQSFGKFRQLFRIKCGTFRKNHWKFCILFYNRKFFTFSRARFRKCLYPQLLSDSINFNELFFSVHSIRETSLWHISSYVAYWYDALFYYEPFCIKMSYNINQTQLFITNFYNYKKNFKLIS